MCGIAGYISNNNSIVPNALQKAAASIQHRGPDAAGFYFDADEKIGLAHRRLSILDLSAAANQPLQSADGRYQIVYNGEVYNFLELKQQLKDKGQSLQTTTDTEVILRLFMEQGTACFAQLNGMFAFAIYDAKLGTLTLCRDHAGIKPLFYYADENNLLFASELKALQAMLPQKLQLNKKAIPYFLHLGFIPQPFTIYEKLYKFPAAHFVQVNTKKEKYADVHLQIKSFWKLQDKIAPETLSNEADAKNQLNNLLLDAVQKQLVSDVPIGTFLSGGIDSSLVTAMAAQFCGSSKINSFSIAIADGKYNEAGYARQVAAHLGINHHEFAVKENEVAELVSQLLTTYDEPFADSSALPTMMVSRLAAQHVKVALSGDGGDELFLGYGMYKWARRLNNRALTMAKAPLYAASHFLNDRYQRAGNLFDYQNDNIITHIFSQEQYYFKENELNKLLSNDLVVNFDKLNHSPAVQRKLLPAERQSLWDFNHYLKDDLLVKVDRASMQYSIESRVPLLDYRLVEFAFNTDTSLKIHNNTMKYLLKEVLYQYVPAAIFDRPKWGFTIPLAKWLSGELKYLVDAYTTPAIIEQYHLLDNKKVQQLKAEYFAGKKHLYNRVWLVTMLHWWLVENDKQN
jgi:asparagine synthase (glutamine-hydrolysing)